MSQNKQKRVLKRVHRPRNGSVSSCSSVESDWVSVISDAELTIRKEPETALVPNKPEPQTENLLYGQSDAFTNVVSKHGDCSPR